MPEVRRRPKNRGAQIAVAAATAFSELGFHAVAMDDIAARVGVSATALYRHSPSKYHLFRDAVFTLSQQLVDCTSFADAEPEDVVAAELFDRLTGALIDTAIKSRSSGGLYRWGGRYLLAEDRLALAAQMKLVNLRLQRPIRALRPELGSRDRWILSVGVLSVIGSIVDQRATLSRSRFHRIFGGMARALARTQLPAVVFEAPTAIGGGAADTGRYEALLRESMVLFHRRGYRETTVEDIAAAVGMPASGVYRHFPGKAAILTALFRRAADRLSADTAEILGAETDPRAALDRLVGSYVLRSFESPEIDYLYFAEHTGLPRSDGAMLRSMQRGTVDAWARVVAAVHPGLPDRETRYVVRAAFALVVDLGRLAGYANTVAVRSVVGALMRETLLAPAAVPVGRRAGLRTGPRPDIAWSTLISRKLADTSPKFAQ